MVMLLPQCDSAQHRALRLAPTLVRMDCLQRDNACVSTQSRRLY